MTPAPTPEVERGVLLRLLPAIYQQQPSMRGFLDAAETLLLSGSAQLRGLEQFISGLDTYLDPMNTPEEFLPWLSSWAALAARRDLSAATQRRLLAAIVPLYSWRGTKRGVEELIELITGGNATINEPEAITLQVGIQSKVGYTTRLGKDLPHLFHIHVDFPDFKGDQAERSRLEALTRLALELAKPAHAHCKPDITFPDILTGKGAVKKKSKQD